MFRQNNLVGEEDFMMRLLAALGLVISLICPSGAFAQVSDGVVKIGILNDTDGPYADLSGKGSVVAAQMAIDEMKPSLNFKVELVSAGHQLKPDVGIGIIRRWFDADGVDMVADIVHSGIALAAQELAKTKNRIVIGTAVGTTDFTGKACSKIGASWLYDTYALSSVLVKSMIEQKLDTWFILAVDYAFGQSMTADITKVVEQSGGKVVGVVRHPLNTADFSSYLLQAQSSAAKVTVLANGGTDLVNSIKQAKEFGIVERGQTLATPLMFITDVNSLGLEAAQGLRFVTPFYWDLNDETRAWSKRFWSLHGKPPTMVHAAVYSAVKHYLLSVQAAGTDEAQAVMAKMRSIPVNDMYVKDGTLREDGRLVHPMYLVEVKAPSASKGPWDYYKVIQSISGSQAFRSAKESGCPLIQ
jgi:branched-chain amino acid transport system substrate-binding protein